MVSRSRVVCQSSFAYPQQPREMGAICSTERNNEPSAAQYGEAAATELQQATSRPVELPTRPEKSLYGSTFAQPTAGLTCHTRQLK